MLQAFDCVRRPNPRTGRKSSEVFLIRFGLQKTFRTDGQSLISVLYIPVSLVAVSEITIFKTLFVRNMNLM